MILLFILSGSGNSLNLVKCARKARNRDGIKQAAIIGFTGGALKDIVDYPVHVKFDDMEISEDIQLSIFHYIKNKDLWINILMYLMKSILINIEKEQQRI